MNSQIHIRSAYPGRHKGSLKQWAREQIDNNTEHAAAAKAWFANKTQQRRAKRAVRGHDIVYTAKQIRTEQHTLRGDASLRIVKEAA